MRGTFVGHFDVKSESALWLGITLFENLRHDLVTEIEVITRDSRLVGRDEQPHELRRSSRLRFRLLELRDLVQLSDCRLFVDESKHHSRQKEDW